MHGHTLYQGFDSFSSNAGLLQQVSIYKSACELLFNSVMKIIIACPLLVSTLFLLLSVSIATHTGSSDILNTKYSLNLSDSCIDTHLVEVCYKLKYTEFL